MPSIASPMPTRALRSFQDLGGVSVNVDWKVGPGRLTSTTAWRYWNWNPSNDRDFIGLPVTTVSAAPSTQRQWTQEVRYAGDLGKRLSVVAGAFAFSQSLESAPSFKQEQGSAAARFLLAPTPQAATPGLLDGYGFDQYVRVRQPQCGTVRAGRVGGHRSPAVAARRAVQLRPEVGRLRSAGLRRPADIRSGTHRVAALDLRAAGLPGRRGRRQRLGPVHRRLPHRRTRPQLRDRRDWLQVGWPESQWAAYRCVESANPRGGNSAARACPARGGRTEDGTVPGR